MLPRMSFSTVVTEIAEKYAHTPGDLAVVGDSVVAALRDLRGQRADFAETSARFVTESQIEAYPLGEYPRLPGGIMSFSTAPHVSFTAISNAVMVPDTLVSSTNLTGDILALQDSAERPIGTFMRPVATANSDYEARWDAEVGRTLLPGTGVGEAQIFRVGAFNVGTDRVINWTVKESAATIATGTFTVDSDKPAAYDITWNAGLLSTLTPAANTISLLVEDLTGAGAVSFTALQWFTWTDMNLGNVQGGSFPMNVWTIQQLRDLRGGRIETVQAQPREIAVFDQKLELYPTPNGAYLLTIDFQADASRDATTNAVITTSATTETMRSTLGP